LNLTALIAAELATGCGPSGGAPGSSSAPGFGGSAGSGAGGMAGAGAGGAAGSAAGGAAGSAAGGAAGGGGAGGAGPDWSKQFRAGISSFTDATSRRTAVKRAIELSGGMPWLKPGDKVAIKVAHNSPFAYPATVSPESCSEIVKMCLDAGASKVFVVDLMGIENTLMPGGWALEDTFGLIPAFSYDKDATIRAFKESGLWGGIEQAVGGSNIGPNQKVHITSFREHGWHRLETGGLTPGGAAAARMRSSFVKNALKNATGRDGKPVSRPYIPRTFDFLFDDIPGMNFPNLFKEVDHIVNLGRVSTHIMSQFSTALKNWVGIMRPDDRIWMHQLTYLLNSRGTGMDPIRLEPPYHELLAETHLATVSRERLVFADASEIIISGGPDESPDPFFPAGLMLAATDVISADVVNLAMLRLGVFASKLQSGLGGVCEEQPNSMAQNAFDYLAWRLQVATQDLMRGTDVKLCDPTFSNWDWVLVQRARELGLGPKLPAEVGLAFADDGAHAVPPEQKKWLADDALRQPQY
jgi:uncharacterized protein (DUF362 family)